jgi:uncharacterized cupin superfamily protein
MKPHIHRISPDTQAGPGEVYFLPEHKRITGNPQQTLWLQYTDPTKQFFVGMWRSEPGKWHVHYTEEEHCHMLEGVSILTCDGGDAVTVRAGDNFVVPRGFVGTWEVVERSTKRFVMFEASQP